MKNQFLVLLQLIAALLLSVFLAGFFSNAAQVPHLFFPIALILFLAACLPIVQPRGSLCFAINAKSIMFAQGKFNPGGTGTYISYAFEEDIESWPDAFKVFEDPTTAVDFKSLVEIPAADPFVMKAGKSFHKVYCTIEEGEVKTTMIGPFDSRGWQNEGAGSFPDNDEEAEGWLSSMANRKVVAIFHENNGKDRVIGFPKYPAVLNTAEYTSGKKVEDGRKNTFTFIAKGGVKAPIYKAPIPYEAPVAP